MAVEQAPSDGEKVCTAAQVLARSQYFIAAADSPLLLQLAWAAGVAYTSPQEQLDAVPPIATIEPLFADEQLLATHKPHHLPTENTLWIKDSLAQRVAIQWESEGGELRVVHRLDWETSGVIVFARTALAARSVCAQFREHAVTKVYIAELHGRLRPAAGTVDLPLSNDDAHKPLQCIDFVKGKPSVTRWQVLSYDPVRDATRVRLEPTSGRRHQLRLHCAALGHPMLGDTLYAPPSQPRHGADSGDGERKQPLHLHAHQLTLAHPLTGQALVISVDPPW
jgi:tRNA pseudouridine32 synthase/23S rRNA pseudouridine746 synthase